MTTTSSRCRGEYPHTVAGRIVAVVKSSEDFVVELRKSREKLKKDIEDKNIKKIGVNIFEDPDSNPINVRPFEEAL